MSKAATALTLPHTDVAALYAAAAAWLRDYEAMGRLLISDRERTALSALRSALAAADAALADSTGEGE